MAIESSSSRDVAHGERQPRPKQRLHCAVLIAIGVATDGKRSVLGVSTALSEAEVHWRDF